jgi:small-conductance mechanosensitive channel
VDSHSAAGAALSLASLNGYLSTARKIAQKIGAPAEIFLSTAMLCRAIARSRSEAAQADGPIKLAESARLLKTNAEKLNSQIL